MAAPGAMPTDATSNASQTPAGTGCACVAAVSSRDADRLATLAPAFAATVRRVLQVMALCGHPMFVVSARRSDAEQRALYAQGRTVPGRIVTHCDGAQRRSKHQDGLAVDCAWVGEDIWNGPWELYAHVAEGLGLVAGAHFEGFSDRPHLETK